MNAHSAHAKLCVPISLVESDEQLVSLCAQWPPGKALAFDTEFERSRTFFPRPGLIQVSDGGSVFLIDPLTISGFAPLLAVLADGGRVKALHACSEDLEVFQRLGQFTPATLFDTQLAGAFLGYGYLSYARLVKALLDVDLAKDETRSNWLKRPLTASQQNYAALDVAYLLPLHERLAEQLHQRGRDLWFEEESARLLTRARPGADPRGAFLRLRQASHFTQRELAVLREVCAWREIEARRRDCPRGFVLRDHVILAIAKAGPRRVQDLSTIDGIAKRELKRNGEVIARLVRQALALPKGELPHAGEPSSSWRKNAAIARALRTCVETKARALGLPAQLLVDRRTISDLLRLLDSKDSPTLPSQLRGWRADLIGDDLLRIVSERRTPDKTNSR